MNFYPPEYYKAIEPDLIIEKGEDTYVCYRKRVPFEDDPADMEVWKIVLYHTVYQNSVKYTQLLYPDGSEEFAFAPNKIDEYTFEFA